MEHVGFIGLGTMGHGMAHNLLKAGHPLRVWNRTPSRLNALVEKGAKSADTLAEMAQTCDILFLCVSDTPDVEMIFAQLEAHLRPTHLIVDHSTISPQTTRKLAEQAEARGAYWLDAPVSGGSEGAIRGTLSMMVGGSAEQLARVHPYLQAMGQTITHVGGNGDGQMVKLVNQVLVVINQLAVGEALLLAKASGLDLAKTIEAVKGGAAGSWMLANRGPQVIARDWRPGFTIDLQLKDLRLVLESADQLGIPLETVGKIAQWYRQLQKQGLGGEGNHALVKLLEQQTGYLIGNE